MSEELIFYLEHFPERLGSCVNFNSLERVMTNPITTQLSLIDFATKDITILLPGQLVTLATTEHPIKRLNKHLASIPYLLEDSVVANIEALHFIPILHDKNGLLTVAIIDKELFNSLISELKQYQMANAKLLPDYLAIPYKENSWTCVLTKTTAILRISIDQGFTIEREHLAWMITKSLEKHAKPVQIHCYLIGEGVNHLDTIAGWDFAVDYQTEQHLLAVVAKNRHFPEYNLLQGQHKIQQQHKISFRTWQWSLGLLISCCLMFFINTGLTLHQLNKESSLLDGLIAENYKQIYPDATSVVSPKIRISQTLAPYHTNPDQFQQLLQAFAFGIKDLPQVVISRLQFKDNKLIFSIKAKLSDQNHLMTYLESSQHLQIAINKQTSSEMEASCWKK